MSLKIFESMINDRLGKAADLDKQGEKSAEIGENALEKNKLLALLPEELRDKSIRENFPIEHIKKIVEFREQKGYKTVIGFHVSDKEFRIGGNIIGGQDGEVHFTTDIASLYMGKKPRFIYAIECSEKCMKTNDENLKWYTLNGSMKIIDKIKMTPEAVDALGARFAECEYS